MTSPGEKPTKGPQAFLELFTPHNRSIFHFILTLVPNWNDAQDVMQETSRVLWEKFDSFEPGTNFVAWALTIAKYQALNFRKKHRRGLSLHEDLSQVFLADCRHHQDRAADRAGALRHCLTQLNAADREHLQLRFHQSIAPQQIAERLGVSARKIYRNEGRIMGLLLRCIRRRLFEEGVLG